MSRRCHHGSPRRARSAGRDQRRGPVVTERPVVERPSIERPVAERHPSASPAEAARTAAERPTSPVGAAPAGEALAGAIEDIGVAPAARATAMGGPTVVGQAGAMRPGSPGSPGQPAEDRGGPTAETSPDRGTTAPQLRRFIKSRAYVPMHELRRRFGINGDDDEVTALELERGRVYIGLPPREGQLLGELLRGGDIGVELSLDPIAPMVVGVYPMRPILRS
jgi:hypothetical protein